MNIRITNDSVEINGYVNAVERKSKPLISRLGRFVERICSGAFGRALERNDNVRILLNHDWNRDLGGTKDGNLELTEDNIGLRARAIITDRDVIEKARHGDLVGWSFGFTDVSVRQHEEDGMPTRDVEDLNLYEVSILDRTKSPAYAGTLISVRADDDIQYYGDITTDEIEIRDESDDQNQQEETPVPIDYSQWENMIKEMREE